MSDFELLESELPLEGQTSTKRCSGCGQFRETASDGYCTLCVNYKTVPAKAHVPRPRWMVTGTVDGVVVFREPFATARAVEHVIQMYGRENITTELIA